MENDDKIIKDVEILMKWLTRYRCEDVLKLFAYTNTSYLIGKYNLLPKLVSPKLLNHIPFLYQQYQSRKERRILSFNVASKKYIRLVTNIGENYVVDELKEIGSFYDSFQNYNLDFPILSVRQYRGFFTDNKEVVSKIYDLSVEASSSLIDSMISIIFFEWFIKLEESKFTDYFSKYRTDTQRIGWNRVFKVIPIECVKEIFGKYGLDSFNLIEKLFLHIDDKKDKKNNKFPLDLLKSKLGYLGIKTDDKLYFFRGYHVMNQIYKAVSEHEDFISYKGDYLEKVTLKILNRHFGEENVFHGVYDNDGNEQDFIVLYKNCIFSFECKSVKFQEPFREKKKSITRLRQNFKKGVQKSYNQSERIATNILDGNAKYFDSDKNHKRKQILDLNSFRLDKFYSVIVTFDKYFSLGTNLYGEINQSIDVLKPILFDVHSLEHILDKCNKDFTLNKFREYFHDRELIYEKVKLTSNDELDVFGFYIKDFHENIKYTNNQILLGSRLSNRVTGMYEDHLDDILSEVIK